MSLSGLIAELKDFEEIVEKISEEIVRENEAVIVEMNTEDQLYGLGQTRTGTEIGSYAPYRPMTIQIKRTKGQPTDRVTLRDTGDFHGSFYIEFTSGGFEIKAKDEKAPTLVFEYGEEIMGLNKENLTDLTLNYILPEIIKRFKP